MLVWIQHVWTTSGALQTKGVSTLCTMSAKKKIRLLSFFHIFVWFLSFQCWTDTMFEGDERGTKSHHLKQMGVIVFMCVCVCVCRLPSRSPVFVLLFLCIVWKLITPRHVHVCVQVGVCGRLFFRQCSKPILLMWKIIRWSTMAHTQTMLHTDWVRTLLPAVRYFRWVLCFFFLWYSQTPVSCKGKHITETEKQDATVKHAISPLSKPISKRNTLPQCS